MYTTQERSSPRIKRDKLGADALQVVYAQYASSPLEQFRTECCEHIDRSAGKQEKKNEFKRLITEARTKDKVLQKVQNYLLAGMGLGV